MIDQQSVILNRNDRPNVLFIVTDDQGPWAYRASGDANAITPNLDRLAASGARLANHMCMTAVCSPARACMLTSRYSTETGIPDYLPLDPESDLGLEPVFPTWPRALSDVGYRTVHRGKWHLGVQERFHPTRHGYDEGYTYTRLHSRDPEIEINGHRETLTGFEPDVLTDLALEVIRSSARDPFALSVHYWAPHANTANRTVDGDRTWLPVPQEDWLLHRDRTVIIPNPDYPKLDVPRIERMNREYLASVTAVDRNVGRLLDSLEQLGIAGQTIVIFTSDNGFNMGHNGIWHKGNGRWILTDDRGDRPNLYDNSLRVPALVRWPGVTLPGSVVKRVTSHFDWFPTLVAAAGARLPEKPGEALRGRDMTSVLRGANHRQQPHDHGETWSDEILAQYSMWDWHQNGAHLRALRTPEWKLIRDFRHHGADELYDLFNDPDEHTNLIDAGGSEIQAIRDVLRRRLEQRMVEIDDPELSSTPG